MNPVLVFFLSVLFVIVGLAGFIMVNIGDIMINIVIVIIVLEFIGLLFYLCINLMI